MPQLLPRRLELIITPELAGLEVNTLLRRRLGLSGTVLRRIKWLEDGITLDGVRVHVRVRASEGQTLSVRLTDPSPTSGVVPTEGPLDIVYEDADLVVVNKASGVLIHPGHGHFDDTLGNYLMWHYRQAGDPSGFHPVHRLDKGTSGLVVVAKHAHAQEKLKNQLHTGDFRRVYLAVCDGAPPEPVGVVDAPIGPVDGSLTAREVRPDGRPARTHYRVVQVCGPRSLVELELETGRTHQIRVHMAHIGCPLTGDFLYGTENRALIARPALHSAYLELVHPITGERLAFSAPLPDDMAALIPEEDIS
ncbi:MAG: RluA family pseudouridine synthase [Clostridiales bacterium]|nr:RluA family pseudouridine synthase [Clostridiales bacterium]